MLSSGAASPAQEQRRRSGDEGTPLLIGAGLGGAAAPGAARRVRLATLSILLVELLERLAFYGVAANLVPTLNRSPFSWISYSALAASFLLSGLAHALALVGGWLSDAWLGSFRACLLAFAFYLVGLLLWPLLFALPLRRGESADALPAVCSGWNLTWYSLQPADAMWPVENSDSMMRQNCSALIIASLCCVAAGSGLLKANLSPFGASQIADPAGQVRFFNWFYWACNVGSFLAYFFLTYVQQNFGDEGLLVGYAVPPAALALAACTFVACRPAYRVRRPCGSVLTRVVRLLLAACSNWRRQRRRRQQEQQISLHSASHSGWLDCARADGAFTEAEVQDTRALLKVALIFASLTPYWLLYFQMQTTYLMQGLHMRLSVVQSRYIPPAWLSLCDIVTIIVLIPALAKCALPRLRRRGWQPSLAAQITAGMCMALLSVLCAGLLESWRLSVLWGNSTGLVPERSIKQRFGSTVYDAADLSVLFQVPQYCLMGVGEAFMSVACLRLAFQGAPRSMKGLITGVFWFTCGCASLFGVGLVSLLTDRLWFFSVDRGNPNCRLPCPDDADKVCHQCHLDYYFYLLAGVQAAGLLLFAAVRTKYYGRSLRPLLPAAPASQTVRPPGDAFGSVASLGINRDPFTAQ